MKKAIKRTLIFMIGFWAIFSFVDYNFARTMYGGMYLTDCNMAVVLYRTLDNLLQGFMF